jgi:hypothetical protein
VDAMLEGDVIRSARSGSWRFIISVRQNEGVGIAVERVGVQGAVPRHFRDGIRPAATEYCDAPAEPRVVGPAVPAPREVGGSCHQPCGPRAGGRNALSRAPIQVTRVAWACASECMAERIRWRYVTNLPTCQSRGQRSDCRLRRSCVLTCGVQVDVTTAAIGGEVHKMKGLRTSSPVLAHWWRGAAAVSAALAVDASATENRTLAFVTVALCAALMVYAIAAFATPRKRD